MNQLAEQTQRPAKPALMAGGAISAIVPQTIEETFRLSEAIHMSGMAPNGFDNPQKVMIAMLAGLEIGLPPMAAVQSVAVINNRPCIWGDALIGVVRGSPMCLYVREWIEGEGDEMVAHCETHRKGEPKPVLMKFSVSDAKKAGLWQTEARVTRPSKGGGTYQKENDSPWYKYPKRMLQMRARAWCLRDVYADVLKGMQVREEVEDYQHVGPDNARDVTPQQPSVMERLRSQQEATQTSTSEREGFDPSFVQSETDATLHGDVIEAETNSNTDENPAPSSVAADTAPSASEAGEVHSPDQSPASNPIPKELLVDFKDYARKSLEIAGDHAMSQDDRYEKLEDQLAKYREAVPEELWPQLDGLTTPLTYVVNGKRTVDQARSYIAKDILQCSEKEIGGA